MPTISQKILGTLACLAVPVAIAAFFMFTQPAAALVQPLWWGLAGLTSVMVPLLAVVNFGLLLMFSATVAKAVLVSKQTVLPESSGWGWVCAGVSGVLAFCVLTGLFGQIVSHDLLFSSWKSLIGLAALAGTLMFVSGLIFDLADVVDAKSPRHDPTKIPSKTQAAGSLLFVAVTALTLLVILLHHVNAVMDYKTQLAQEATEQAEEWATQHRLHARDQVTYFEWEPEDPNAPLYAWLARAAWDAPNISPDPDELWLSIPALGPHPASVLRCAYMVGEAGQGGFWVDLKPIPDREDSAYHTYDVLKNYVCRARGEEYRNGR